MIKYLQERGVHAMCDGQFGSTGKGLLAAYLAQQCLDAKLDFQAVVSNAGPNSGHTFYYCDEKHVLKQLPTFGVYHYLAGKPVQIYLSAGAVINPNILEEELNRYPGIPVKIHRNAAVIDQDCIDAEQRRGGSIEAIASTQSGTGAAISRKVLRYPQAIVQRFDQVMGDALYENFAPGIERMFMEISQGFSLGINQRFFPHCTSRECTVAQGFADAGIPPRWFAHAYMAVRTFPIRVGNLGEHSSGGCYPDQVELDWKDIGQRPELTTVTQRERRLFSFSCEQLGHAIVANAPSVLFVNFMNYVDDKTTFVETLRKTMGPYLDNIDLIFGHGPCVEDVAQGVILP